MDSQDHFQLPNEQWVLFLVYQKQIQQIWFKSLNFYNHDKVDMVGFLIDLCIISFY
jgi:hypothetical protein